ncbi:MAG: SapC family protein [Rhodocyclales bacterium]|nr:SapC family protein [Rhodocyclales bacterium]
MATLLFYEKPVPLNVDVHLKVKLGSLGGNLGFAANTNSIPLAAVEFVDAAREYPIAFTGKEGGALFPIALLGVRHNENLFITEDNRWEGRYIPAFVRRYPFVLAEKQDADDFNVYLDESYAGFGAADGDRLFTDEGEHTPLLKQALEFLSNYQGEIKRTRLFVERLQSLDLLIPRVLEVVRGNEAPLVLQGFSVVDEQRLAALGDAELLALAKDGYLALVYAHLGSLGNIARLSERLDARLTTAAQAPAIAEPDPVPSSKKKR